MQEQHLKYAIPFTVSARTARLIGQENFANAEGAIIELVKNSYDADAKVAIVVLDNTSTNKNDHTLYIIDNGHGMDEHVLVNNWMRIGTNNKEIAFKGNHGRIKTGAKGIGRFALDRLGRNTYLISQTEESKRLVDWEMDWLQFEEPNKPLSEINASINSYNGYIREWIVTNIKSDPILDTISKYDFTNGTVLKITNLRDVWNDLEVKGLYKGLEALIPPSDLGIFDVYLYSIAQIEYFGKVSTAFFNDFDYKVEANFDSETLNVKLKITRDELDLEEIKTNHLDVFLNKKNPYDLNTLEEKTFEYEKDVRKILKWKEAQNDLLKGLGDFKFSFYFLRRAVNTRDLETYPFKDADYNERKETLDRFGGVKIYRDSFRVRPYGEPGDDWLELGKREAASPAGPGQVIGAWRVRSSQIAGTIFVSRVANSSLNDKSDRSSLIENESFTTLKKIIIGIISEFEYDRSRISNPFYIKQKRKKEQEEEDRIRQKAEELADEIVKLRDEKKELEQEQDSSNTKEEFQSRIESIIREFTSNSNDEKDSEEATLRGLASLGITVASFAHELRGLAKNLGLDTKQLRKSITLVVSEKILQELPPNKNPLFIIDGIEESHQKMGFWLNYSLTGINRDKRNRTDLNLFYYFDKLKASWQESLTMKNIALNLIKLEAEKCTLRAFEIDFDTIFNNLIANTIDAFNSYKKVVDRLITIDMCVLDDKIVIKYQDNGPGLSDVFSHNEEIFLPFVSSKKDENGNQIGTGLGMYLAKRVVETYNGNISVTSSKGAFEIILEFPKRK